MRIRAANAVFVLLACAPWVRADEPRRATPTMAREAAEENSKTPAGRRYQTALDSSLDKWLRATMERCVKGVAKEQALSFNAYVQVGGKGDAEDVLFEPVTDVTRCAEPDFKAAKYPSPPEASWWVRIEIQLK